MSDTYRDLVNFAVQITEAGSIAQIYFGNNIFAAKSVDANFEIGDLVACVGTDDNPLQIDASAIIAVRDSGPLQASFGVL